MTEEAFADIVGKTKIIVLSAIKKYLYDGYSHAIDDIVQETYLRAYKSLVNGKFREEAKISSWLYTIARNETFRMNKKLMKLEKIKEKKLDSLILFNEIVENSEFKRELDIEAIIKSLPEKYKSVMRLYIDGKKEKQISDSLSIPVGTVKSRLHRGKKMLQKYYNKEYNYV